jgi:hypothetical protein
MSRVQIPSPALHSQLTGAEGRRRWLFCSYWKCRDEEATMADNTPKKHRCEDCPMRRRAEANPKALVSRVWKWHTGWCPGWKAYQKSLAAPGR